MKSFLILRIDSGHKLFSTMNRLFLPIFPELKLLPANREDARPQRLPFSLLSTVIVVYPEITGQRSFSQQGSQIKIGTFMLNIIDSTVLLINNMPRPIPPY